MLQIAPQRHRDATERMGYLEPLRHLLPRLAGAVDRNPFSPTYGCFDREFRHYRTADFPSEMHQEGVWPLAWAYSTPFPGNPFHRHERIRELALAGVRYAAKSCRRDGSCDDYYPFEQALGAAVFSFCAAAETCLRLRARDGDLLRFLRQRGDWILRHQESGRLTNHHALAARGLLAADAVLDSPRFRAGAAARIEQVLAWQSPEGWFEEYGGADPGYQTVTLDALTRCRELAPGLGPQLADALHRGVRFCRSFLHPDGSYGGEYGSRGTYHFYPAGMERLAAESSAAAELADGFLRSLRTGTAASFSDDRMYVHRAASLADAYDAWSSRAAIAETEPPVEDSHAERYPAAGLYVLRSSPPDGRDLHVVASACRGGIVKAYDGERLVLADAGPIVAAVDGRIAVAQQHVSEPAVSAAGRWAEPAVSEIAVAAASMESSAAAASLEVSGPLHWVRFETMSTWKLVIFRLGLLTVGRFCRTLVRKLLQRRLITGRQVAPLRFTRRIEVRPGNELVVTDRLERLDPRMRLRRLAYGSDHQTAYVAACGVHQDAVLFPWTDDPAAVAEFNEFGRCERVRRYPLGPAADVALGNSGDSC